MTDVLVVGAGPTGLALALDLARRSVPVRIVDRSPTPFAGSRGKGVTARTQEVFDDFGIIGPLTEFGARHMPHRVIVDGRVVRDSDPYAAAVATPNMPYESGLMIPQFRTERILRDRLRELGVDVEYGMEMSKFEQTDAEVLVQFTDGSAATCAWMVGCDGGRSTTRKALGLSFEGDSGWQGMLLGDVEVEGLTPDRWYQWTHPEKGFVALCPFRHERVWQFQGVPFADFGDDATLPPPNADYFQEIVERVTGRDDIRVADPTWLSTYRVNVRMVDRLRVGRVLLAGDAAHVHSPAGGLGMNTGIQDAYNLGWKLGAVVHGAPPSLLDTYAEERLPIAKWTLGVSTASLESVSNMFGNEDWQGIAAAANADGQQLGLGYPWSSLSRNGVDGTNMQQAGDRAPDMVLGDTAGNPIRLFDVFRGPHATVLGFGSTTADAVDRVVGAAGPIPVRARIVDREAGAAVDLVCSADGLASAGYAADTIVLVRPDGYIGAVATSDDPPIDWWPHRNT